MPGLGAAPIAAGAPPLAGPPVHQILPGGAPGGLALGALGNVVTESGPWVSSQVDAPGFAHMAQAGQCMEVVVYNGAGQAVASAVVRVRQRWPTDAAGWYAEVDFFGCSDAVLQQSLAALFTVQHGVLHGCLQTPSRCHTHVLWPGRGVLHTDVVRLRAPGSLTDHWLPAQIQSQAVLASIQASAGTPGPSLAAPGAAVHLPAPAGDQAVGGAGGVPSMDKAELQQKLSDLKARLRGERSTLASALARRAKTQAAQLSKRRSRSRRRTRKKNSKNDRVSISPSSSSSGSLSGARSREWGTAAGQQAISALAAKAPGTLLQQGLSAMRQQLQSRTDMDDMVSGEPLACAVQYINSVWHGHYPPSEMGQRNAKELRLLGVCLDCLVRGELAQVGDILMQRLKSLEQFTKDGHWQVAQFLEVRGAGEVGLATQSEVRGAVKQQLMETRLRDSTSRQAKTSF